MYQKVTIPIALSISHDLEFYLPLFYSKTILRSHRRILKDEIALTLCLTVWWRKIFSKGMLNANIHLALPRDIFLPKWIFRWSKAILSQCTLRIVQLLFSIPHSVLRSSLCHSCFCSRILLCCKFERLNRVSLNMLSYQISQM